MNELPNIYLSMPCINLLPYSFASSCISKLVPKVVADGLVDMGLE